jgi:hypothetical protein
VISVERSAPITPETAEGGSLVSSGRPPARLGVMLVESFARVTPEAAWRPTQPAGGTKGLRS